MASNYLAKGLKRSALAVALSFCVAGGVQAQSTTGGISGTAPAGSSVTVTNNSGFSRTVTANESGRFNIGNLPIGNYTIESGSDRREVVVTVGASAGVSLGGDATTLGTVTVTGTNVAQIDIAASDTRTVLTAQELGRLPMRRSAESIALLAPGAIMSTARNFGGLISFGGAGVSENSYYVNGFFTGNPVSNLGGNTLPYGVLDQQETFTGGYSAKYGRSDGGVINQIGRRGTNDWHFGGQIAYIPDSLRSNRVDEYFPNLAGMIGDANTNPNLPHTCGPLGVDLCQYEYGNMLYPGALYTRGKGNKSSSIVYTAYVGGPIVQDRLFFFIGAEYTDADSTSMPSRGGINYSTSSSDNKRLYFKLDWNITNDHLVEYSFLGNRAHSDGLIYDYDFNTDTKGALTNTVVTPTNTRNRYHVFKYTGYLTDSVTLSAIYGQSSYKYDAINPALIPGLAFIAGGTLQNPAYTGGTPILNDQPTYTGVDSYSRTHGLRVDLEWVIGDHTVTVGIDNMKFEAVRDGTAQVAQLWQYGKASSGTANVNAGLGVGAAGGNGYWVRDYKYTDAYSSSLIQRSYYIEDRWQITDNLLLSLGLRNDSFTNKNGDGVPFMEGRNQWAPRLGFVWDTFGDSSFKVFGNAGRYFLSLPNSMARRGASASNYSYKYYTYTGINADGTPILGPEVPRVGQPLGTPGPGYVSANGELGFAPDPKSFAPSDLKYIYSDEFILGFEAQLTPGWYMGAKLTSRSLKSSVDDFCDYYAFMDAAGLTPYAYKEGKFYAQTAGGSQYQVSACYMFNPGGTNTYNLPIANGTNLVGGYGQFTISSEQLGFHGPVKRNYNALDLFLMHPFDGKWEARIDYTYSRSRGNTEGQVKSEFGQADISKTQDWDSAFLMYNSYGYMANDHRHQIKIRGSYAFNDEWMVSGNLRIQDGMPISCLGFFNPDGSIDESTDAGDPIGYGSSYHTCLGKDWSPGASRTPWTRTFDLGVTYRPNWFDKRLTFGLNIYNVFNSQRPTQFDVTSETAGWVVSNTFMMPAGAYGSRQPPRSVMLNISYDY